MISEKTDAQAPTENRLAGEKSPYLLQHADNPVNWHPWGQEALDRARQENKPVFLSIGYATCHWCHVMAHESFEDEQVAEVLNRDYVSIKVDREERPDIDLIYMNACQAMTRSGGWPLSIFMSPEGKPFFAGTYFPKESRMGMPGFMDLLHRIKDLWDKDRERLLRMGEEVLKALQTPPNTAGEEQLPDESTLGKGFEQLHSIFDATHGGFGSAPKFPTPHNLMFLLRWHRRTQDPEALQCVEKTLQAMRNGGIFDQVGFGFSRYSVDEKWLVPHFEKMLYDQAQLAMAYIETYQSTGGSRYANVAREIFTYVRRDMTSPGGGFYSAEDADSEGREGLFYVWKPEEIREILGPDAGELFCKFYNIVPEGNFEDGLSIPHITREQETFAREEGIPAETLGAQLEDAREKLFQARCGRIHPLKDDKILTSWNGLMIAALARGSRALADPSLAEAAGKAAEFILYRLSPSRGTLLRRYRDGEAALPGYVDDYAFFIWGLIELYEATFQVRYLEEAVVLQESMLDLFQDADRGGFFFSGRENESLIVRSKEAYDQALPSGNSVAAMNLLRLGRMTGNPAWEQQAEQTAQAFAGSIRIAPAGHTQFLAAVDFMVGPSQEVVITGAPESPVTGEMIREVHGRFLPRAVLLLKPPGENGKRIQALAPFLEEMEPKEGGSAAFVCEQYACRRPVTDLEGLRDSLDTC